MFKNNPFKDNPLLSEYYERMVQVFSKTQQTTPEDAVELSNTDYSTFKVVDLKAAAKARGLKGYTRLKKSELIDLLNKN